MNTVLNLQMLATFGGRVAILGTRGYALPVRFRIHDTAVDCQVPAWSGVGDLLDEYGELTLIAVSETGPYLRWFFLRGPASVVPDPDWEGLNLPVSDRVGPDDLYQLLRIRPQRIELVDEERGWGFRETADL